MLRIIAGRTHWVFTVSCCRGQAVKSTSAAQPGSSVGRPQCSHAQLGPVVQRPCMASLSRGLSRSELETLPGNDKRDQYSEWLGWQQITQLTQWSDCPGHRRHGTLQPCQGLLPVLQALLLAAVQGEACCQWGASSLGGSCTLAQESVQGQPCGMGFGPADQRGENCISYLEKGIALGCELRAGRYAGAGQKILEALEGPGLLRCDARS